MNIRIVRNLVFFSLVASTLLFSNDDNDDNNVDRFWWFSCTSSNTDTNEFMTIFETKNLSKWSLSRSRIDGMTLRRESANVLDQQRKDNTVQWQAMKAFIPTWNITYAMNTGAMNKSWIKEKSGLAEELRESDLKVIENLEAAGAKHITVYMQSPMSKGPAKTFVDGPDGASIETRIKDIKRYINWIKARRPDPDPIKLDFALIDAHPPKGIYPDPADYKDVYRQLAIALKQEGIPFVGIMIDWKATSISSNGAQELIDICKWVQTDLSKELGIDYYAGWWIWYYIKNVPHEELYARAKRGVNYVMSKPDNYWIRHVYVGAKLGDPAPLLPDTVDYKLPIGRLEGINENYERMEPSTLPQ